jgi:hypothetical protein
MGVIEGFIVILKVGVVVGILVIVVVGLVGKIVGEDEGIKFLF